MKATINGIEVSGTPEEIAELIGIIENKAKDKPKNINPLAKGGYTGNTEFIINRGCTHSQDCPHKY